MKIFRKTAGFGTATLLLAGLSCSPAKAQAPEVVVPVVVDTAAPIIVKAIKPKPKANGLAKFEGFVLHANNAQITARQKNNEMSIQTFSLSGEVSAKMQQIVDKGGYQWGDKITVYYDPATMQAARFKGKPSKPI
jgi:hypothetical protein